MAAMRVGVRKEFSDEAVWRETLGPQEPLFVHSTDGDISAREYVAAGGMKSSEYGPRPLRASPYGGA